MVVRRAAWVFLLFFAFQSAPATAGLINLNDVYNGGAPFMSNDYTFSSVIEANGPANAAATNYYQGLTTVGNSLLVNPTNFRAEVNPGAGANLLDSQLEMVISAKAPGGTIPKISMKEVGDYEVIGFNPGDATVRATINWYYEVLSGAAAGAFDSGSTTFTTSATPNDSNEWQLAIDLPMPDGAESVRFEFDNRLSAIAQNGSIAFIAKKQIPGGITITVPEPSSAALCGVLVTLFGLAARRRLV
jgi:hypothetical protein